MNKQRRNKKRRKAKLLLWKRMRSQHGKIVKLSDGRAGIICNSELAASGKNQLSCYVAGLFQIAKPSGTAFFDNDRIYWDKASRSGSRHRESGFYLGRCVGDPDELDLTMIVNMNTSEAH